MNENAQKVYDYLIMNPEKHSQIEWVTDETGMYPKKEVEENFCGTTMCAAGAAVWLTEGQPFFSEIVNGDTSVDIEGHTLDKWTYYGAQALGIDYNVGDKLFNTMNKNKALDMLNALAQDDMDKFNHIYVTVEDTYNL